MTPEKQVITNKGKKIKEDEDIKLLHWLTANAIVHSGEKEIYDKILQVLKNELNPQSFLETIALERIAIAYTKLQRVVKMDSYKVITEKLRAEIEYSENILKGYEKEYLAENEEEKKKSMSEMSKEEIEELGTYAKIMSEVLDEFRGDDSAFRSGKYDTRINEKLKEAGLSKFISIDRKEKYLSSDTSPASETFKRIEEMKTSLSTFATDGISISDIKNFEILQKYEISLENQFYNAIKEFYKIRQLGMNTKSSSNTEV